MFFRFGHIQSFWRSLKIFGDLCCSSISSNSVLIHPRPRHQNPSSHFRSETFTMFDLVLNRETNPKYISKPLVSIQKKLDNLNTIVDELSSIADALYEAGFPWHSRGDGIFMRRSNPFWEWNSRLINIVVFTCRFNTFVHDYHEDSVFSCSLFDQFANKFGAVQEEHGKMQREATSQTEIEIMMAALMNEWGFFEFLCIFRNCNRSSITVIEGILVSQMHLRGCICLLYTSPSPRDYAASRMPSSA